jgi:hypothetical protein
LLTITVHNVLDYAQIHVVMLDRSEPIGQQIVDWGTTGALVPSDINLYSNDGLAWVAEMLLDLAYDGREGGDITGSRQR